MELRRPEDSGGRPNSGMRLGPLVEGRRFECRRRNEMSSGAAAGETRAGLRCGPGVSLALFAPPWPGQMRWRRKWLQRPARNQ